MNEPDILLPRGGPFRAPQRAALYACAFILGVILAAPGAEAQDPLVVVTDHTLGVGEGTATAVGPLASVTGTAANATVLRGYVEVQIDNTLNPSGIQGATLQWSLDSPSGTLCSGSVSRAAGLGAEAVHQARACDTLATVNGTYWLNVTGYQAAGTVRGSVRPVVVQQFEVTHEMVLIETSIDAWLPLLIYGGALVWSAVLRSGLMGFVGFVGAGLYAAGAPWDPRVGTLWLVVAFLAYALPRWWRERKSRAGGSVSQ